MFQSLLFTLALFLLLTVPSGAHGSFVYVTNYGDGTISQFRANPNGTLTPLNPPAVKAWPRCHSLAADPSGRFLYVLSALEFSCRDCVVSQFRIGNDGGLTPLSPSTVPVSAMGSGPSLIVVNPTGPAVYTMGRGSETTTFRIESHGHLVPLTPIATANAGITGPDVQLTFHPSLPLLYRAYQGAAPGPGEMTAGGVDVLAFRADGQILDKPVQKLNMDGNGLSRRAGDQDRRSHPGAACGDCVLCMFGWSAGLWRWILSPAGGAEAEPLNFTVDPWVIKMKFALQFTASGLGAITTIPENLLSQPFLVLITRYTL